ncbi:MAG: hypothetical protein E7293_04730 [Lachnospiraceae bacterium]|nr:hypothetical protein [Lachnospiraceae bacterium]
MDNFIDKIAQKLTAQEMIRANAAADAAELQKMKAQAAQYEELLREIRAINRQNAESAKLVQDAAGEALTRLQSTEKIDQLTEACLEKIHAIQQDNSSQEAAFAELTDHVHKENVKVYRNVQAVVVEETAKLGEQLAGVRRSVSIKLGVILGVSIVSLLTAAASLTFQILTWMNVI